MPAEMGGRRRTSLKGGNRGDLYSGGGFRVVLYGESNRPRAAFQDCGTPGRCMESVDGIHGEVVEPVATFFNDGLAVPLSGHGL